MLRLALALKAREAYVQNRCAVRTYLVDSEPKSHSNHSTLILHRWCTRHHSERSGLPKQSHDRFFQVLGVSLLPKVIRAQRKKRCEYRRTKAR